LELEERPDQRASVEVLVKAGVERGLILKLQQIHPPSVVALASLRSWAEQEVNGQLPTGEGDIAATEGLIWTALRTVFVADIIQSLELDDRYGPLTCEATERVRKDGDTGILVTDIQRRPPSGNGSRPPEHRPQTAALQILCLFMREGEVASFFKSRLTKKVGQRPGGTRMEDVRASDVIKQEAAEIAAKITKSAAGVA